MKNQMKFNYLVILSGIGLHATILEIFNIEHKSTLAVILILLSSALSFYIGFSYLNDLKKNDENFKED